MRSKRINDIEEYIYKNKTVTLDQLCKVFQVSKNTIRRDLKEIILEGNIKKIYGGVTTKTNRDLQPFSERDISDLEAKKMISAKAANLIEDGDVIFIDSGTTTCHIVEYLKDKKNLTIITNSLEVLLRVNQNDNIKIISLSGELDQRTLSFTGDSTISMLKHFNITKAFMASTGVSVESGVTNSSTKEHEIKSIAVRKSRNVYLLITHDKFHKTAIMTYCGLDQLTGVISDENPPEDIHIFLSEHNIDIYLAK